MYVRLAINNQQLEIAELNLNHSGHEGSEVRYNSLKIFLMIISIHLLVQKISMKFLLCILILINDFFNRNSSNFSLKMDSLVVAIKIT